MEDSLRVLLVDDNPDAGEIVRRGLQQEFDQVRVTHARSHDEFTRALELRHDVAVTAYRLGWGDGFTVHTTIKSRDADLPVLMLLAPDQQEFVVEAVRAGLDAYIIANGNYLSRLAASIGLVHERRVQRRAAREVEAELHRLFDRVPVGLYRMTPAGHILEANSALVQIVGAPDRQTLLSQNAAAFFPSQANFEKWRALVEAQGDVHCYEGPARRATGEVFWARNSVRVVHDPDGSVLYYEGAMEDISERKKMEDELRESRSFFEQAQQVGGIGSWVSGLGEDNSLIWSRQTYRIFGIPESTPINVGAFFAAVHPDDRETVRAAVTRAAVSRAPYRIEHRIVLPDGGTRWVSERAEVMFDSVGNAQKLIGVCQDITERKRAEDELRLLQTIALTVSEETNDLRSTLEVVLRKICEATGWIVGEAWLPSEDGAYLHFGGASYCADLEMESFVARNHEFRYAPGEAMLGSVWQTRRAIWIPDVSGGRKTPRSHLVRAAGLKAGLAVPVMAGEVVVAVLSFFMRQARAEDERLMSVVSGAAAQLGLVIQRKRAEARLQFLAHYDGLTGLPNRSLLTDRLIQTMIEAGRHQRQVGLVFLDLDRFKNINDSLGHEVGDQLIKSVAERVTGAVRKGDTVARLSGDELAVVLADMAQPDDAARVASKILAVFTEPFHVCGNEIYVTASLGVTLYPGDDSDAGGLLRNADVAMYRAKEAGGNCYQFYAADMASRASENMALENDLRHAIERNELVLHYQPLVDAASGRVVAVEALVRWKHPTRGLVSPMQFIPLAEESGLIVPIGEWVLRSACRQCKRWRTGGHGSLRVAVNLSARQFAQEGLDRMVIDALRATELEGSALELELTESVIMQSSQDTLAVMQRLAELGVSFSIDDFGTGYSNLSYLKRFPVDILKVDRSFVQDIPHDPDDTAIADAIITMAHSLGMHVVAEGVENEQQSAFLRTHGCDTLQGYYFSKPLPADEAEQLLRDLSLPAAAKHARKRAPKPAR